MRKKLAALAFAAVGLSTVMASAAQPQQTTAADRKDLVVTIYNNNKGLVREVRSVNLPKGRVTLRFADVAERIVPQSVHLVSRSAPGKVDVVEQNYRFDVLSPGRLMKRAVGTDITFVRENPATGEQTRTQATLLAHDSGDVYRVGKEIVVGNLGRPVFSSLPPEFVAKPTLLWELDNSGAAGKQDLEVSYLSSRMSWKADYVAVVSEDDKSCSLNGWVTVNNDSGAAFPHARLALVSSSSDENRDGDPDEGAKASARRSGAAMRGSAFREESLLDYHLYTLQRTTDLADKEQKQIALLSATGVPTQKVLRLTGTPSLRGRPDSKRENMHPQVYLTFRNDGESRLGLSLPAGTVRVYKADHDGGQQFIGEDRVSYTPVGEQVKVLLGESFDVVAERRTVKFDRLSRDLTEATLEVKVRNHKDEAVTVQVQDRLAGDWTILEQKPVQGKKLDAHHVRFELKVPSKGEAVLTYKVRAKFGR